MKTIYLLLLLFGLTCASAVGNKYKIESVDSCTVDDTQGTCASAVYTGKKSYYLKPMSTIAQTLNVTVSHDSPSEFTVRIMNGDKPPRFVLPYEYPFSYTKVNLEGNQDLEYQVDIHKHPFSFSVNRVATNETIFNTANYDFMYSEFFLTFGTKLPSKYLYGLGERASNFLYESGTYTIWNKDQPNIIDNGTGGAQETYGTHPVYLMREDSGKWHMVYLRTTNGLDFTFDSAKKDLKYMITGGFIELKFFLGDENPETAIKMYHKYINGWEVQPFWALGFHQSRWGYTDLQHLKDVVSNMTDSRLPLDVLWSDIDYMTNYTDFTVDASRYDLQEFRSLVKQIHFVPIIDAGIAINKTALPYTRGEELDIWVDSTKEHGSPLIGHVWPGVVNYPDWLNKNTPKYWTEMMAMFYDLLPVSGIWLDMNENSNFCQGECPNEVTDEKKRFIQLKDYTKKIDENLKSLNNSELPFLPGGKDMDVMTLSLNAVHDGGVLEFDVHNLNGFYETMYTHDALYEVTQERPFVLTRSNFVGSGQFAAHWTGDNSATWEFLRISIPTLFNFQVYGMPMVGADICGFMGNTTVELCSRWMQLGAFYPFMRNHNHNEAISQEPYALGSTVLETSRAALNFRYSILKFYYSLFIKNNGLGSIFKPLFFDFHKDKHLLGLESQFLIGSELMAASVGYENLTKVDIYFPAGATWYDFFTGDLKFDKSEAASNISVDAPLNTTLPVFIKEGSVVHTQEVNHVRNTSQLDNVFNLVVALSPVNENTYQAHGQMLGITDYLDDSSVNECIGDNDCLINLAVKAKTHDDGTMSVTFKITPNRHDSLLEEIKIKDITFYGLGESLCGEANYNGVANYKTHTARLVQFGEFSIEMDSNDICLKSSRHLTKAKKSQLARQIVFG